MGVLFVAFGVYGMADPVGYAAMTEVALATPTAIADGRAVYGGLNLAFGVLLLMTARGDPPLLRFGLWVLVFSLGAQAVGRVVGIAVADGAVGSTVWGALGIEALFTVLAAGLLARGVPPVR